MYVLQQIGNYLQPATLGVLTWNLLTEADIEKRPPGLFKVPRCGCDRDVGMHLNFLDGSIKAEISNREAITLCQMQGNRLVALLSRQGLFETFSPCGGRQVQCAVLRDGEVPGEAVERHREAGIQFGHSEESRRA